MRVTSSSGTRRSVLALTSTTRPLAQSYRESRYHLRDTDGSKLAAWNTANEDLYNVLFFTTKGVACSVVRRFAGKTLDESSGHRQRAWAALREKLDGCSSEALRAEHAKMNSAQMRSDQDPDEFLYELDTRRERRNACDPPEVPMERTEESAAGRTASTRPAASR